MKYDYYEAMESDIRDYIDCNIDFSEWVNQREDLEMFLNDELITDDNITGNGSGSYTFNTYMAEENLSHNLDLLIEASKCFGNDVEELLEDGAEACAVVIRRYILPDVLNTLLDELESDGLFDEEEEEEDEF